MRLISATALAVVLVGCAAPPRPGVEATSSLQPDSAVTPVRNAEAVPSDESAIAGRGGASGAWGFTFGTNRATSEAHARLDGDEVTPHGGTLTVVKHFDKQSQVWSTFILQFCNDRVYLIAKLLTGVSSASASGFIDTLYGFAKAHGNPRPCLCLN